LEDSDGTQSSRQPFEVGAISRRDDGRFEGKSRRDYECVHRVRRPKPRLGEKFTRIPRHALGETHHDDTSVVQDAFDRRVLRAPATDFGENWRRDANERTSFKRSRNNRASAQSQSAARSRMGQGVQGFGIED